MADLAVTRNSRNSRGRGDRACTRGRGAGGGAGDGDRRPSEIKRRGKGEDGTEGK